MTNSHIIIGSNESPAYPNVRKIGAADLRDVLSKGIADFKAMPSHLVFLGLIYPIAGIWLVAGNSPQLLLPLLMGFPLIGSFAALGFYEISRRRELGLDTSWTHAFGVARSHSIFSILSVGMLLLLIFTCWIFTAQALYASLFGPAPATTITGFAGNILGTHQGWKLIGYGTVTGFFYAVAALSLSVVSFPLLLDRDVEVPVAIFTSVKAVLVNPFTMALWGLIVAVSLAAGFLLVFAGLAVVVPVLAHSTWHLYRKVVEPAARG